MNKEPTDLEKSVCDNVNEACTFLIEHDDPTNAIMSLLNAIQGLTEILSEKGE